MVGIQICPSTTACQNTPGSYACNCREGYEMKDGGECEDINECLTATACPRTARCVNFHGGYDCLCPYSHVWNGSTNVKASQCSQINFHPTGPCAENGGCGPNSLCKVEGWMFNQVKFCVCTTGYIQRGDICMREAIDETPEKYIETINHYGAADGFMKKPPLPQVPATARTCFLGVCY
eukprot:Trichotokara_eunicae@DN6908_c0_g1_i1.p1